jgi:hypothetical protein
MHIQNVIFSEYFVDLYASSSFKILKQFNLLKILILLVHYLPKIFILIKYL